MSYVVNTSIVFDEWFENLEEDLQDSIAFSVGVLEQHGYQLGRPHVDTLSGSKMKNLKELRVQYENTPYRILFAFDPEREALLLIGGNKASSKRWYEDMIPKAETIFEEHLAELDKGR